MTGRASRLGVVVALSLSVVSIGLGLRSMNKEHVDDGRASDRRAATTLAEGSAALGDVPGGVDMSAWAAAASGFLERIEALEARKAPGKLVLSAQRYGALTNEREDDGRSFLKSPDPMILEPKASSFCALTDVYLRTYTKSSDKRGFCQIDVEKGHWRLRMHASPEMETRVLCQAACITWKWAETP